MRIQSIFTFMIISALVFASAGYIVYASLSDKDSNLHIAERLAENVMDVTSLNAQEGDLVAPVEPKTEVLSAQVLKCDPEAPFMKTSVSLVNYLKQNGLGGTYNDRIKLAADYGLTDYKGNNAENLQIMNYLKEDLAVKNHCTI